ncbi:hypothetical protein GOP47_0028825 [Adiantum capillus-veneris]|nr:hypothetical protein GOP47_0028825 [Adiantum capillus-veneris]
MWLIKVPTADIVCEFCLSEVMFLQERGEFVERGRNTLIARSVQQFEAVKRPHCFVWRRIRSPDLSHKSMRATQNRGHHHEKVLPKLHIRLSVALESMQKAPKNACVWLSNVAQS